MFERVQIVVGSIFNVDPATITRESSPDTIENWDSIGHMNLVVGLEEEFEVEIGEESALEMMNVDLVCDVLEELGVEK